MARFTTPMASSDRAVWVAYGALGSLVTLWGAAWFPLFRSEANSPAPYLLAGAFTALALILGFCGILMSLSRLVREGPDPRQAEAPAVKGPAFLRSQDRWLRIDRPGGSSAGFHRHHTRYRWPE
jgi:hypothetical protein